MSDNEINVRSEALGFATQIVGLVGTREVVCLSNGAGGVWRVSSSTCLPTDLEHAKLNLECTRRAFALAREHGAP